MFGDHKFKNAARQREHKGMKYILSRVFPTDSEVKEYYSNALSVDHSLPYYNTKRWISWMKRSEELKRQICEIISTDKDYIDQTEKLSRRHVMAGQQTLWGIS